MVAVSCALFGVTYRYAVRGEEANLQLKGGVVAAFGLVSSTKLVGNSVKRLRKGGPGGSCCHMPPPVPRLGTAMPTCIKTLHMSWGVALPWGMHSASM